MQRGQPRRSAGPIRSTSPTALLLLTALLSFPLSRRIHLEWWKFVLDAAMVLVGGGVLIWYFAVRPEVSGVAWRSSGATVLSFAYPLASLLRAPRRHHRAAPRARSTGTGWAFGLLVAGVLLSVVADLTFGLIQRETGEREREPRGRRVHDGLPAHDREHGAVLPPPGAADGRHRGLPAPVPAAEPAALRGGRRHLRAAAGRGLQARPRAGDPARGRRPRSSRGSWWCASCSRCGRTSACSPRPPRGRTRPGSARWCSIPPTSSSWWSRTGRSSTSAPPRPGCCATSLTACSACRCSRCSFRTTGSARSGSCATPRQASSVAGPDRVALPPARRLRAPDRDHRHQPARRADGARHRAQHPRRERTAAPPAGAGAPGLPRFAHRPRQPGAVPGPGQPRAGPRAAAGPRHHRAVPRPRRLQEGQRQPRALGGRPAAPVRRRSASSPAPAPPTPWPGSAATNSRS